MFTGIITGLGRLIRVDELAPSASESSPLHGKRLTIQAPAGYLDGVALGDSIALQGACMTVTTLDLASHQFTVDISQESLQKTTGLDSMGAPLNLEKALRVGDHLGGHIVSGHVDGTGVVSHFAPVGESWELRIACPLNLAPYLVYKGSITINGVSLTVNQVLDTPEHAEVSINLIPHTLEHTTLGKLEKGSTVNLEIDTVARYVQRMLETNRIAGAAPSLST
jgi:riboflavin synthase